MYKEPDKRPWIDSCNYDHSQQAQAATKLQWSKTYAKKSVIKKFWQT